MCACVCAYTQNDIVKLRFGRFVLGEVRAGNCAIIRLQRRDQYAHRNVYIDMRSKGRHPRCANYTPISGGIVLTLVGRRRRRRRRFDSMREILVAERRTLFK